MQGVQVEQVPDEILARPSVGLIHDEYIVYQRFMIEIKNDRRHQAVGAVHGLDGGADNLFFNTGAQESGQIIEQGDKVAVADIAVKKAAAVHFELSDGEFPRFVFKPLGKAFNNSAERGTEIFGMVDDAMYAANHFLNMGIQNKAVEFGLVFEIVIDGWLGDTGHFNNLPNGCFFVAMFKEDFGGTADKQLFCIFCFH